MWLPWFSWLLEILEFIVLKMGWFSNSHLAVLVVSVVLMVSSVKTNNPLPKQPLSSTPIRAEFWGEDDEDSNCSVLSVRQVMEWPEPFH